MQVVLLKDIETLGEMGERVKVADGYARNFLIPRKLAAKPAAADAHHIEAQRRKAIKEKAQKLAAAEKLATKLSKFKLTINKKVGDQQKLFGSVTVAEVAEGLQGNGFMVDKKQLHMPVEHIKELGTFKVTAKLHADVTAEFKLKVDKEEEQKSE